MVRPLATEAEVIVAMHSLNDAGAQWVVVTDGPSAGWATSKTEAFRFVPPKASPVINPIGAGDCMAAGLAWACARGWPFSETLAFGLGCAADNVTQLLPARLRPDRVAEWAKTACVERLDC